MTSQAGKAARSFSPHIWAAHSFLADQAAAQAGWPSVSAPSRSAGNRKPELPEQMPYELDMFRLSGRVVIVGAVLLVRYLAGQGATAPTIATTAAAAVPFLPWFRLYI